MPTEYAKTHEEKACIVEQILDIRGGVTVTWQKGKSRYRSVNQNKLQRLWMREAAEQLKDDSPEGYRGYCKLHYGVPIMCEHEEYLEAYQRIIGPLPYEYKLEMMQLPLDYPVTRLMSPGEKKRYLDDVYIYLTGAGARLTKPNNDYDMSEYGGW